MMKIYVGNLPYDTDEDSLRSLFAEHGTVNRVNVVTDRQTGRPRGFAFVEMAGVEQGKIAIDAIHGRSINGRMLTVNEARPKENRSAGGRW